MGAAWERVGGCMGGSWNLSVNCPFYRSYSVHSPFSVCFEGTFSNLNKKALLCSQVMDGREGQASMSEYFHMLEVSKQLFGINDDNYYTVSTAVASIMMGM